MSKGQVLSGELLRDTGTAAADGTRAGFNQSNEHQECFHGAAAPEQGKDSATAPQEGKGSFGV